MPTQKELIYTALVSPEALANFCQLQHPGGPQPLSLWEHQKKINQLIRTKDKVIVVKARQLGVSEDLALLSLHTALSIPNSKSLAVSIGEREAQHLLQKVKDLYNSLPHWLIKTFPIKRQNLETIIFEHGSEVRSLPARAGRGYTASLLLGDEFDHWEESDKRLAELIPAVADRGKVVLVSTPNGVGGALYREWQNAAADSKTARIFIPANARPDRTEQWITDQRRRLDYLGPQEYPLTIDEAFISSGHNVFNQNDLTWQTNHTIKTGTNYTIENGKFKKADGSWTVWSAPVKGRTYLITADPAGGGQGSDASAAAVYDLQSCEQVAAFHTRILPHEFASQLAVAGKSFNGALICPENNNHGNVVIAHLMQEQYPNIYQQESFSTTRKMTDYGWNTNKNSKTLAIDALKEHLREHTIAIRDVEAIRELERYTEFRHNKFGASEGHDDRVICHAIAAALMGHSYRASHRPAKSKSGNYHKAIISRTGY